MWTSVTGLLAHSEKMGVVSNNIANVNTVGYKGSRMDFADFVTQSVGTLAGNQQVGCGVTLGAIYGDFAQGSFETTTEATDLAISGNGFFTVVDQTTGATYYTRAGNFRFSADGYLVDPNGYVLQGWEISTTSSNSLSTSTNATGIIGQGVPVDIKLDNFSCDPHHTSYVTMNVNLDSSATDNTTSATGNDFAALMETWSATYNVGTGEWDDPLSDDSFAYQTSITVYDEGGTAHVLTIYFDKVDTGSGSDSYWEFIVTMDPSEDKRDFDGTGTLMNDTTAGYTGAGLLMTGVITFNSSGQMTDMAAYVPGASTTNATLQDTSNWELAPLSDSGYPMLVANFTGRTDASSIYTATGDINPEVKGYTIDLNLGYRSKSGTWDTTASGGSTTLNAIGTDPANLPGMGSSGSRNSSATTSYASSSAERNRAQDGYTSGELSAVTVSTDGVLSAKYSNGVSLQLYQITLATFNCETGLYREGGNLYSATRESGEAATGAAGSGTFGTVYSNSLESSNVDLSSQLVDMIIVQRGFQANSKSITTVDTMLETVIGMKR